MNSEKRNMMLVTGAVVVLVLIIIFWVMLTRNNDDNDRRYRLHYRDNVPCLPPKQCPIPLNPTKQYDTTQELDQLRTALNTMINSVQNDFCTSDDAASAINVLLPPKSSR